MLSWISQVFYSKGRCQALLTIKILATRKHYCLLVSGKILCQIYYLWLILVLTRVEILSGVFLSKTGKRIKQLKISLHWQNTLAYHVRNLWRRKKSFITLTPADRRLRTNRRRQGWSRRDNHRAVGLSVVERSRCGEGQSCTLPRGGKWRICRLKVHCHVRFRNPISQSDAMEKYRL